MKDKISPIFLVTIFPLVMLFSFFLNYISSSYSEIDLFKIDLVRRKESKKMKKLVFILKNSHLLFAVVCSLQVIFNMLLTNLIFGTIDDNLIKSMGKTRITLIAGFGMVLFTELFSRYLATRPKNRDFAISEFMVNLTYYFLYPFSPLRIIIKPKKKLFSNSEQDVARLVRNLKEEKLLEEEEALLVNAALTFDEKKIELAMIPWKKVIFIEKGMGQEEVKKICLNYPFSCYPVLDQKKKVIGILRTKKFFSALIKNGENFMWQNSISKKILYLNPEIQLSSAFKKIQLSGSRIAIVQKKGKNLGIVSLKGTLSHLVGKFSDKED